ncbi:hypothetical protein NFI96_021346 [Prochilodus magdalenae]|nr:hypothetical protein NFI96_021346 [Prochilodus magdalenae]
MEDTTARWMSVVVAVGSVRGDTVRNWRTETAIPASCVITTTIIIMTTIAIGRLSWSDSEWQRVIFSDESRFSLGGDAQRIRVWRHRGQHRDERFGVTRPEDLVSLHLHPYRTICRNCVRMFKLHGMDYHRTPLGTSTAPYRDVWRVALLMTELLNQWLWQEHFWLPPGSTWQDFGDDTVEGSRRPLPRDLALTIPLALGFIAVRFVFERVVALPLSRLLGVCDRVRLRPPPEPRLEAFYLQKKGHFSQCELMGLVKQCGLTVRQAQHWLRLRRNQDKPSNTKKFCEASWRFVFYLIAFAAGLASLIDRPWFWSPRECWRGLPRQPVDQAQYWYYLLELSFYWSLVFCVSVDVKRKWSGPPQDHHRADTPTLLVRLVDGQSEMIAHLLLHSAVLVISPSSVDAAHRTLPTGRCPQDAPHRTLPTGRCPTLLPRIAALSHRTLHHRARCVPQDLPTGHCRGAMFMAEGTEDFKEQIIHHIATIFLISFSYCANYVRVGTLVLLVHDSSDFLLESAKMFNYAGWRKTCDGLFVLFALAFLVTRLVIFPCRVLYATLVEWLDFFDPFPGYYFFNALLLVLQVLHIFWAYLILRMVYKFVFLGKVRSSLDFSRPGELETLNCPIVFWPVERDERSDEESEGEEQEEEEEGDQEVSHWERRKGPLNSKPVSLANNCVLNNLTNQRRSINSRMPKTR